MRTLRRVIAVSLGALAIASAAEVTPARAHDEADVAFDDPREYVIPIDPSPAERPGNGDGPALATYSRTPVLLGGSSEGIYSDGTGASFNGAGYTVVVIDGAFDTASAPIAGAVVGEACFGLLDHAFGSLCNTANALARPLPEDSLASHPFSNATGSSRPSNSPTNTCVDISGANVAPFYCHYFHGTATAAAALGKPLTSGPDVYSGAAPGAKLVALKVGGGTGTTKGWPGQSIVDALNYVNSTLSVRADLGPIAAVTISTSGNVLLDGQLCSTAPSSPTVRINDAARALKAKGIPVVMSAGNDASTGRGSFNCGDNIVRVGASRITEPTQPTSYTNISPSIPLYAPSGEGTDESQCVANGGDCSLVGTWDNRVGPTWGTSFSAPEVAGAFAVLRQKYGMSRSVDQLVALLKSTGRPLAGGRAGAATANAAVINIGAALKSKVVRVAGADRYAESAALSRSGYPSTAATVYVASGEDFPDALSAGAAATKKGGPLLLTAPRALPAAIAAELSRLKPSTIVVAGGPGVVSDAVFTALRSYAGTVRRVSGIDRYETSRRIADDAFASAPRVYVSVGDAFPDAISAGGAAGALGAPIILVPSGSTSLNSATRASILRLSPSTARIVGGAGILPDSFLTSMRQAVASTTRVSGIDRWGTSANVNLDAFTTASTAYLVNGLNFPDGLSAAPIAGKNRAPVFISNAACVPRPVLTAISRLGVTTITLAGGTGVLTPAVESLTPC